MDMPYATIPVFGEQRRLYKETRLAYMVSSKDKPNNHPIYMVYTDLGSSIFYNDLCSKYEKQDYEKVLGKENEQQEVIEQEVEDDGLWSIDFDGVVSKKGARVGVWLRTLNHDTKFSSFKLYFECTNNIAEQEALILGLNVLKDMKEI